MSTPTSGTIAGSGAAAPGHVPPAERIRPIDALRGFDMFWISGGDNFFHALATASGWAIKMRRPEDTPAGENY